MATLDPGTWWSKMLPGELPAAAGDAETWPLPWAGPWERRDPRVDDANGHGSWHILKILCAPGSTLSAVCVSSHETRTTSPWWRCFYGTLVLHLVELRSCQTWLRTSLGSELQWTRRQETPIPAVTLLIDLPPNRTNRIYIYICIIYVYYYNVYIYSYIHECREEVREGGICLKELADICGHWQV